MKFNYVKTQMNLNKLTKLLLECKYYGVATPPDGLDTVRFDNRYKKIVRLIYITNHAKTDFVKPIRNVLLEHKQSEIEIDPKKDNVKMITINLLEKWNGATDMKYLVCLDKSAGHSYYSVAYVPKEKCLMFYKPGLFDSKFLKRSYKEVLTLFNIKASRKLFGFIKI